MKTCVTVLRFLVWAYIWAIRLTVIAICISAILVILVPFVIVGLLYAHTGPQARIERQARRQLRNELRKDTTPWNPPTTPNGTTTS
jgi:hypothetical protein